MTQYTASEVETIIKDEVTFSLEAQCCVVWLSTLLERSIRSLYEL